MVSLRLSNSVPARARAGFASLTLHAAAAALLFTVASSSAARRVLSAPVRLVASSILAPYLPPAPASHKGGGGGGDRSPLPASRGRLPRIASRQFTPPAAVLPNPHPVLGMEATLVLPPDTKLPEVDLGQLGNPWSGATIPSNGPGCCGGIGEKRGRGVGPGNGDGAGPGDDGIDVSGISTRSRGASRALAVLYKIEPDYTDDARKAQLQGTVVLRIEVDENGRTRNPRVIRPLGMGLDERAVEAVQRWLFRPAYRDGRPTAAVAIVEVNFRLL